MQIFLKNSGTMILLGISCNGLPPNSLYIPHHPARRYFSDKEKNSRFEEFPHSYRLPTTLWSFNLMKLLCFMWFRNQPGCLAHDQTISTKLCYEGFFYVEQLCRASYLPTCDQCCMLQRSFHLRLICRFEQCRAEKSWSQRMEWKISPIESGFVSPIRKNFAHSVGMPVPQLFVSELGQRLLIF